MAVRLDRQSLAPAIVICGLGFAVLLFRLAHLVQLVDDARADLDLDPEPSSATQ